MLKHLRWQLTLLYLFAALGLVTLLGAGSYTLLQHYFQSSTDLALQYRMATEFQQYNLPLPAELAAARQEWLSQNGRPALSLAFSQPTHQPPTQQTNQPIPQPTNLPPTQPTTLPTATAQPTSQPTTQPTNHPTNPPTNQPSNQPTTHSEAELESEGHPALSPTTNQLTNPPTNHPTTQPPNQPTNKPTNQPTINGETEIESEDHSAPSAAPLARAAVTPLPASTAQPLEDHSAEDSYDGELAAVFVRPLDAQGQLISDPNPIPAPAIQDPAAGASALARGSDLRTITLDNGARVRLLTYRTSGAGGPQLLQTGRLLTDQDRTSAGFLTGLALLGSLCCVLLAAASWWLAGRLLAPARQAWDQQQVFVSNASHELRTPLTLVKATAEVALRAQPGGEQSGYLLDIRQECDYMSRMVDDLLLLSRLDSRRLVLKREPVDLEALLSGTQAQVEVLARQQGVSLELGETAGQVWGDPDRLRQVLLILLDNALRFTPPGGRIRLETAPRGKRRLILVTDSGRGIPAEHLPHIFERFYQVPRPGHEESRSNGLGLSIARGLVEAMGGAIHAESRAGQGARMVVSLNEAKGGIEN